MKKILLTLLVLCFFVSGQAQERFGGAMLYTVRDEMKASPQKPTEAVAALGYEYVELAGYADGKFYGMEPAAFKALLAKHGLKAISSHPGYCQHGKCRSNDR